MSRSRLKRRTLLATLPMLALGVATLPAAAIAGSCGYGHGCVATGYGGGEIRDFATSDGNVTDNYYDSGKMVAGNIGSIRNKNSNSTVYCDWSGYLFKGYRLGFATYSNTWSGVIAGGLSLDFGTSSFAC